MHFAMFSVYICISGDVDASAVYLAVLYCASLAEMIIYRIISGRVCIFQ